MSISPEDRNPGLTARMSNATPYPCSYAAKRLVEEPAIPVERAADFQNRDAFTKLKLAPAMFFDTAHFGRDALVVGNGRIPRPAFIAAVPLSQAARRDIVRLYGNNPDYLAGQVRAGRAGRILGWPPCGSTRSGSLVTFAVCGRSTRPTCLPRQTRPAYCPAVELFAAAGRSVSFCTRQFRSSAT
jgi:hypothetical protein